MAQNLKSYGLIARNHVFHVSGLWTRIRGTAWRFGCGPRLMWDARVVYASWYTWRKFQPCSGGPVVQALLALSLSTSIMFKGCSASVQGPREENLGSTARELVLEHTIVTIPLRRYDTWKHLELWWSRSTFRTIRNYIPIITAISIIPLIRATFIAANHAQIALSQKTIVWISRGRKRC